MNEDNVVLIDDNFRPFWDVDSDTVNQVTNSGYDSRSAIMNDNLAARDEAESKAKADYYAAKKATEVQNTMFGGSALANTPNHNTSAGVRTSTAKSLATFGVALLQGALVGAPVGVAAAMGLNQAGKQYGRDMNRSYRLNQALNGDLDNYTDLSIQDYILSGNRDGLIFQEEENSQLRKFNERPSREQFIGSADVFSNLTGLEATPENGFQGAGMYSKDWDEFSGNYDNWKVKQDPRIAETALTNAQNRNTGSNAKAFAGGATQFEDNNGLRTTLYRMDDGSFRNASNQVVDPMAMGLTEVDQDSVAIAKKIMTDATATPNQRDWAAGVLQQDDLKANERGLMTPSAYESLVENVYQTRTDIGGLDASLEVLKILSESDASRIGQGTVNTINRYLEPMGLTVGQEDLRKFYQSSEADRLELVASLVRAFAPVSDTAMELVQDSLKGKTFEQTYQAVEATRRRLARNYNGLIERGEAMQVGGGVSELEPISTVPTFDETGVDDPLGIR
ncbi:hypothetical protein AB4259_02670 [Vibrio amylolyticus]|uniref:hypothetical protein n=1 Tax=Vibrio amylolyticus TaxID=2847292 RepID=UPI00354DB86E